MMTKSTPQIIGRRVRQLRTEKGLSQAGFAEKLRCDKSLISKIESGTMEVSPLMRLAICNVFAVREVWLLHGEGEMYDDRWALLEARAKELGDDVFHKLSILKATKKAHGEFVDKLPVMREPPAPYVYAAKEQEYIDKLLEIFRSKDEGVIAAITQNIDTFLRVEGKIQKKSKAQNYR